MSDKVVRAWVSKAEKDWSIIQQCLLGDLDELADGICFHGQQCAEKYLKAGLAHMGLSVPKIHYLPALLERLVAIDPNLASLRMACDILDPYAVGFRYPGDDSLADDAKEAVAETSQLRDTMRRYLGCI